MNSSPSPSSPPAVPSIHIQHADDTSALFDAVDIFPSEVFNFIVPEATTPFPCSQGLQPEFPCLGTLANSSSELEDIPELSHLNTAFFTGYAYSLPHSTILQENTISTDGHLTPSSLGSPSPTSSFSSSLSPSLPFDAMAFSDSDSPVSPSPATPDEQFPWPPYELNHQSSDSLMLPQSSYMDSFSDGSIHVLGSSTPLTHRRSRSSPSSRREPVASKAMLEANSRRRRHPAQFECPDCNQTFTALFSLKRHAQSHTGERPFVCGIPGCSQRFYNSSDCKRHEKSKKRHKEFMMQ